MKYSEIKAVVNSPEAQSLALDAKKDRERLLRLFRRAVKNKRATRKGASSGLASLW